MKSQSNWEKTDEKRRWAVPLGAFLLVLILGAIAAGIGFGIKEIYDHVQANKAATYASYEVFLQPVVLFDPQPFDDISQAQNQDLLKASYWAAQLKWNQSDQELEPYRSPQTGVVRFKMPQEEILSQAERLFDRTVQMESFTIDGVTFEYSQEEQCIFVPVTSHIGLYSPRVTDVKKENGQTVLTVQYIADSEVNRDAPEKVMLFYLSGEEGQQTISAIRNSQ